MCYKASSFLVFEEFLEFEILIVTNILTIYTLIEKFISSLNCSHQKQGVISHLNEII